MKPATSIVLLLLCAIVLFLSATAQQAAAAQDVKPKGDTEYGVELASGRCIHGCCNRSPIIRRCRVCCASAEEAKAFAQLMKDGMGRRGGATAAEAKAEAINP